MAFSNISHDFIKNSDYRKGISAGLNYEFQFSDHWLIGADLLFVQKGYNSEIIFTDQDGVVIGSAATKDHYDYLSLPLKAGYVIGKKIKGYAKIGISTSMVLKAESITPDYYGYWQQTGDYVVDYTGKAKRIDMGGIIEFGAGYEFSGRFRINLLTSYNHSFTSVTGPDFFKSETMKHRSFNISLGLEYKLKKGKERL
jgi:opacity protein-like surface antigen